MLFVAVLVQSALILLEPWLESACFRTHSVLTLMDSITETLTSISTVDDWGLETKVSHYKGRVSAFTVLIHVLLKQEKDRWDASVCTYI